MFYKYCMLFTSWFVYVYFSQKHNVEEQKYTKTDLTSHYITSRLGYEVMLCYDGSLCLVLNTCTSSSPDVIVL